MKIRVKIVLPLIVAMFIGGCGGATSDDLQNIVTNCNFTYEEFREQNSFPKECLSAIEALLPTPENNLNSSLLALGQRDGTSRELFVLGASSIGEALDLSSAGVTITATTSGGDTTTLTTSDYTIGKISDLSISTILSISSVLDYSASMSDEDIDDSVTIFSDIFSIFTTPLIESEIRLFSETVYHKLPFTTDKTTLLSNIAKDDNFERDSTALLDAIGTGLTALSNRTTPIKAMVISTDGMENASTTYTDRETIYRLAYDNNIPVIIIGTLFSDLVFMKELASRTNGIFIYNKTILKVKEDAKLLVEMIKNIQVITITKTLPNGTTLSVSVDGNSVSFN